MHFHPFQEAIPCSALPWVLWAVFTAGIIAWAAFFPFFPLLRVGLVPVAQGGCWQGRGRVRFVGAVSSGTASPHAPACPLGLVSPVKCAVSWSTSKHATQLGVHKTLELQRLGLEKASDT